MARHLAILASTLLLPAVSCAGPARLHVPGDIAVPPGHRLFLEVEASGVQIYRAEEESGHLKWTLEAPLADLFDTKGDKAGFHYLGPSWEAMDGSKVVLDGPPKSAPAPNPKEDIPWLLVKVKAEGGRTGILSPAVYIQRLETQGGAMPAESPKRPGTRVGVAYRAVYHFYARSA